MGYISGVIIFVGFVIFFGSVLWLSGQKILSTKEYKLYFKFSDVVGLKDRSPVYMRGYRIGWAKDVRFEKEDVIVRVDIKRKYRVPVNSKVEINTLNFIGEKAITITPGLSQEYLKDNSIVDGENKDIMNIAKNILTAFKGKIDNGDFDRAVREITETVTSSHALVNNLSRKAEKLDMELYNKQIQEIGSAAKNLREYAGAVQADIHKLITESSTGMQNLDKTLKQIASFSSELAQITQKLNRG